MNRHLTPGCKTAILINGIPASGKSTITRLLAETFSLPVLTIDGIKEPFMARSPPSTGHRIASWAVRRMR